MIEERIKIPSLIYSLISITLAIAIFFGNAANLTKSTYFQLFVRLQLINLEKLIKLNKKHYFLRKFRQWF